MTTTSDTDTRRAVHEIDPTVVLDPARVGRPATPGMRPPSLGLRFFLLAAALLITALALTVGVADWRSRAVAERTIRADLERVPTVLQGWLTTRSAASLDTVASLAREPGTRSIFAEEVDLRTRLDFAASDAPTVLGEVGTVFLFDRTSRVLARSDRLDGSGVGRPFAAVPWVASVLDTGRGATGILLERDQLAVVAAAPVMVGEGDDARLDGVLAATFPLGESAAEDLRHLTRGGIVLVTDRSDRDEPARFEAAVSTVGLDGVAVVGAVVAVGGALDDLAASRSVGPVAVPSDDGALLCLAVPIAASSGTVVGAAVVARSRAEEMASFRAIRRAVALAGGVMLLLALPVSYVLGRRVARPLAQLAAGAEAIRDGRLDVELPSIVRGEEGVLARAFAAMVEELREKRALEELVGQLRAAGPSTRAVSILEGSPEIAGHRLPHRGEIFGGRYRVVEELGRGGMAVVMRARDLELDEDVALKILQPRAFSDATEGATSLRREVRLARRITHPNVVRVHDLVEAGGLWCLSMEYVPGTTLLALMRARGALALAPAIQISKQLCRGLGAVHDAGIVHRDIKPQNIMVLPNGVVKVMDFGISSGHVAMPEEGALDTIGTPSYMSPEQCLGRSPDRRSDVYSLGVLLWEMFVGEAPFIAPNLADLMQMHVSMTPSPLPQRRPDIPPPLASTIMSCLAKDPDQRPQSAATISAVLRGLTTTA
jgi:serine/threonine-protein kinase